MWRAFGVNLAHHADVMRNIYVRCASYSPYVYHANVARTCRARSAQQGMLLLDPILCLEYHKFIFIRDIHTCTVNTRLISDSNEEPAKLNRDVALRAVWLNSLFSNVVFSIDNVFFLEKCTRSFPRCNVNRGKVTSCRILVSPPAAPSIVRFLIAGSSFYRIWHKGARNEMSKTYRVYRAPLVFGWPSSFLFSPVRGNQSSTGWLMLHWRQ
jgi:hypothetical protein